MSKRSTAIAIMTANSDRPMDEVCQLIAEGFSGTLAEAKSFYKWIVKNGKAPGAVAEASKRGRKAAISLAPLPMPPVVDLAAAEAPAPAKKASKAMKAASAPEKSPEEIERIKAANLKRLKEVSAKAAKRPASRKAKVAEEVEAPATFMAEADPFASPASLSMDEVAALV